MKCGVDAACGCVRTIVRIRPQHVSIIQAGLFPLLCFEFDHQTCTAQDLNVVTVHKPFGL
jgi:hypothetical protein